jgi:hypothetical protein
LDLKVRRLIKEADSFVVLLTKRGSQSRWVQQEIGAAQSYLKRVFVLKARSVGTLGMLEGTEYLPFSVSSPELGIQRLTSALVDYAEERRIKLYPGLSDYPTDFQILHLPESLMCRNCKHVDVHVFVCLRCGEWVCGECGSTIPPDSKVRLPKAGGRKRTASSS